LIFSFRDADASARYLNTLNWMYSLTLNERKYVLDSLKFAFRDWKTALNFVNTLNWMQGLKTNEREYILTCLGSRLFEQEQLPRARKISPAQHISQLAVNTPKQTSLIPPATPHRRSARTED